MNWDADCKVMLRIYRSHIRTQLKYRSSFYSTTRKSYIIKSSDLAQEPSVPHQYKAYVSKPTNHH